MNTIIKNINAGQEVNKVFNNWLSIKSNEQYQQFIQSVKELRFGVSKNVLDIINEFGVETNVNSIVKRDFINELKQILN